jgi:hypothetical protein
MSIKGNPVIVLKFFYRWGGDPAGGVGCLNSDIAGVEFDRKLNSPQKDRKFPPRKCLIWDEVGFWGVGASGSTAATTNMPESE